MIDPKVTKLLNSKGLRWLRGSQTKVALESVPSQVNLSKDAVPKGLSVTTHASLVMNSRGSSLLNLSTYQYQNGRGKLVSYSNVEASIMLYPRVTKLFNC